MKRAEFDALRPGDKVRKRRRPDEELTVLLNDNGAGVLIVTESAECPRATRIINGTNWSLMSRPKVPLTDARARGLVVGEKVRHVSGVGPTFCVVLNDKLNDLIVAIEGETAIAVESIWELAMGTIIKVS